MSVDRLHLMREVTEERAGHRRDILDNARKARLCHHPMDAVDVATSSEPCYEVGNCFLPGFWTALSRMDESDYEWDRQLKEIS